jgi:hypothetical protein
MKKHLKIIGGFVLVLLGLIGLALPFVPMPLRTADFAHSSYPEFNACSNGSLWRLRFPPFAKGKIQKG